MSPVAAQEVGYKMPSKSADEMDTLKVPPRIQRMNAATSPKEDTRNRGGGSGLGYQNTLVSTTNIRHIPTYYCDHWRDRSRISNSGEKSGELSNQQTSACNSFKC